MKSLNKITLIGHVGTKPEARYTQNSLSTSTFSLATNESWIGADNRKHEHTEWHSIVAWHKLADFCVKYLNKGSFIYLEGSIRTRSWEDSKKTIHKKVEIIAKNLILLDKT